MKKLLYYIFVTFDVNLNLKVGINYKIIVINIIINNNPVFK